MDVGPRPEESDVKLLVAFSEGVTQQASRAIDLMKHLTTLSSGIILFVAAFRDKIPAAHWTPLIPASIVCLLICIGCSTVSLEGVIDAEGNVATIRMLVEDDVNQTFAEDVQKIKRKLKKAAARMRHVPRVASISFAVGLFCIGLFVIRNFV